MATRSLTEAFVLMRNNSMQSRHIYSEQSSDDRVALVNRDVELGNLGRDSKLPPEWVDGVEEIHYEITRIRQKIKELSSFLDKHVHRPSLDDTSSAEATIERSSQEITHMFQHCQRLIHQINARSKGASAKEQRVSQNVVSSLVTSLQDLYFDFRRDQSSYLKKLKSREERSQHYFDTGITTLGDSGVGNDLDLLKDEGICRGLSKDQMLFLEDNTWMSQQREQEINQVVRSIAELHEVFKDLAHIVVDQGTILDRIDYNIEHSSFKVKEGLKQLQKAETYQKKNPKMYCILGLALVTIVLIIILIAVKLG